MAVQTIPRDAQQPSKRTREALDLMSLMLNSLLRDGSIVFTGPGAYAATHNVFFGSGAPAASLGTAPCVYFDIGDPNNVNLWWKT